MRASMAWVGLLALAVVGCGGSTSSSGGGKDGGAGTGAAGSGGGGSGGTGSGGTSSGGTSSGGTSSGGTSSGGAGGGSGGGVSLCGGLVGGVCAADEFCDFPPNSYCGGDDSTGVCVKRPSVCPENCAPICGCDGKEYCNACMAHAAGSDDSSFTTCLTDAGGKACGGKAGIPCAADEWCDQPDGCGYPDSMGVCKPRPQGCTADCPGVCGCDGKIYCNACVANSQGMDTSNLNTCSSGDAGQGSSCNNDFECQAGLKCCYPCGIPGCSNACIPPDSSGNCPMFP